MGNDIILYIVESDCIGLRVRSCMQVHTQLSDTSRTITTHEELRSGLAVGIRVLPTRDSRDLHSARDAS